MVTIVDYKNYQSAEGKDFCVLIVQGSLEAVKSQETDRIYFTARTAKVPCTFNEEMCKKIIGTDIAGSIKKVKVEPYDYTIPETSEIITLEHRYEFVEEENSVLENNVLEEEEVF
ncbi:hypothetical protein [Sediminibacter sp. Hel_I_10]|uniref:hypothetical protein n=1 Tax=Sediminibacter sp. Hel_I_10 TaxID=1392490 RepID=UPI00047C7F1D|nr:hypothetical protein [Sediminibacter sp. Hel_I_10]